MKKPSLKLLLMLVVIAAMVCFFALDLVQYVTLENLKHQQQTFEAYYQSHRLLTLSIYFMAYVLMAALSLPGAAVARRNRGEPRC